MLVSRTLCLFALYLLGHGLQAYANDSSVGDDNGGLLLTEQANIQMHSETLSLSETAVDVRYQFINTSAHAITTDMAFPMPAMYFGMSDHNAIADFKLWVNDQPQTTQRRLVVLLAGHDIWPEWKRLGWSENDMMSLMENGESPAGKTALPPSWFDAQGMPRFTVHEYFTWQQHFPAKQPIQIRHHYIPSLSTGVPQSAATLLESYGQSSCIDAAARKGIQQREGEYGADWALLRYILTTANNWQGPIGEFHLIIKKRAPGDLLSLCFSGQLQKTAADTFEYRAHDYTPPRDLEILFVRRPE